jgi:hypothetical protein
LGAEKGSALDPDVDVDVVVVVVAFGSERKILRRDWWIGLGVFRDLFGSSRRRAR